MRDYSEIPGWFNEEWLYDRMIGHVREGATLQLLDPPALIL